MKVPPRRDAEHGGGPHWAMGKAANGVHAEQVTRVMQGANRLMPTFISTPKSGCLPGRS